MRLLAAFLLALALGGIVPNTASAASKEDGRASAVSPRDRTEDGPVRKSGRQRNRPSARPNRILVPMWIGNGPATGLKTSEFQAKLAESDASVAGVRDSEVPLILFVAIDFSADLILTESAKTALSQAIRDAGSNVYVSLLRIPEQPMVILDPTSDRDSFIDALQTLPMSGRAGFFEMVDVVASVTNPILARNKVRAAVLYLTDSEIRNYRQDYTNPVINSADSRDLSRRFPDSLIREKVNTLTNELLRTSIPMFVVHLNYRNDPLNEAYQTGIKRLAQSTGGRSVFCRSIAEIPVAIGDMVNAIQAMGMLEVTVPAGVSGAVPLSIRSTMDPLEYRTVYDIPR